MIKYKVFKASKEKEINDFLAENHQKLAADGIRHFGDNVCIYFNDLTEEEIENEQIIKSLKQGLLQAKVNLASATMEVHFNQGKALTGGGDLGLKKATKAREDILAEIYYLTQVMEMVKNGSLVPKIENPVIKVTEKDAKKEKSS